MSNSVQLLQPNGLPAVLRYPSNNRQSTVTYVTYGRVANAKGYIEGSRSEVVLLPIEKGTSFSVTLPGDLVVGRGDDEEATLTFSGH